MNNLTQRASSNTFQKNSSFEARLLYDAQYRGTNMFIADDDNCQVEREAG